MPQPGKALAPGTLRVVVADDDGFMRIALRHIIESDGDMRVVGEARSGEEAVSLARALHPDVITMDIEMPGIDGIEATRRIVGQAAPAPIVVMVSGYAEDGAAATIDALRAGAADFVSKHSTFARTDLGRIDSELRTKIRVLAERRSAPAPAPEHASLSRAAYAAKKSGAANTLSRPACIPPVPVDLIVIAVSTGGPAALGVLLRGLGSIAASIVVAQHMPQFFTACLAEALAHDTGLTVREGGHRQKLCPGEVMILPGAQDGVIAVAEGRGYELRLGLTDSPVHPSGDRLLESAADVARNPVAVILTGMGDDGVRGAAAFARRNLPVLVQRPDTCVVGGMPGAAIDAGVASDALTLDDIAARLRRWASPDFTPNAAQTADR